MRFRWIGAIAAFLAVNVLFADYTSIPKRDLRRFDPVQVGRVETDMWISYYGHHRLNLFLQLTELMRDQYHLSYTQSIAAAYRAARAAVVFQRGSQRSEYEAALPDLVRFYQWILGPSRETERAAKLELEWWIVHRERSRYGREALELSLAELQAEIYRLPVARFREHARLRAEAMLIRDERADWPLIRTLLEQSWSALHTAVSE